MPSSNTDIRDVAELLAKRAAVVRMVPPTQLKKQAMDQPEANWLSHLGNTAIKLAEEPAPAPAPAAAPAPTPALPGVPQKGWLDRMGDQSPWTTGLIGGLGGAGLGGIGGLLATSEEDDENKWRNALTGALAGGAFGGGLGAAAPSVGKLNYERRLAAAQSDLESKIPKPGYLRDVAGKGLSELATVPVASGLAYQAHRSGLGPKNIGGHWLQSGLESPASVFAKNNQADIRKFIEETSGSKFSDADVAKRPTLASFEKAIREGGGKEPSRLTTRSASGTPWLRKERPLGRLLLGNRDPYYVTGRGPARLRGAAGTIAAMGLPMMAQMLWGKAMPNPSQQALDQVQALRRKQVE